MVIGPGRVNFNRYEAMVPTVTGPLRRRRSVHAAEAPEWPGHRRHHRLVAVVADPHPHPLFEIDALDAFEKTVHEMLPRLLAVADDVDPGVLLQLQRQQG